MTLFDYVLEKASQGKKVRLDLKNGTLPCLAYALFLHTVYFSLPSLHCNVSCVQYIENVLDGIS